MEEEAYEGRVFGEISAMTQFNRLGTPLTTIVLREDLHPRLLNGSDYPLPAINILVRTGPLMKAGYITAEQRILLNEIYHFNPLLYDFVLKRCVVAPGTGVHLPAFVFHNNRSLNL
jgi:mannonate dehydratase